MRDSLARTMLATLGLGLATIAGPATASLAEEPVTSVARKDKRDDIAKNWAPERNRSHNIDIYKVAATVDDEEILLRLTVDNLTRKNTTEVVEDGWHSMPVHFAVNMQFSKKALWQVSLAKDPYTGDLGARIAPRKTGDHQPDCAPDHPDSDYGKATADLKRDRIVFRLPVSCTPQKFEHFRAWGLTAMDNDNISIWDFSRKTARLNFR